MGNARSISLNRFFHNMSRLFTFYSTFVPQMVTQDFGEMFSQKMEMEQCLHTLQTVWWQTNDQIFCFFLLKQCSNKIRANSLRRILEHRFKKIMVTTKFPLTSLKIGRQTRCAFDKVSNEVQFRRSLISEWKHMENNVGTSTRVEWELRPMVSIFQAKRKLLLEWPLAIQPLGTLVAIKHAR